MFWIFSLVCDLGATERNVWLFHRTAVADTGQGRVHDGVQPLLSGAAENPGTVGAEVGWISEPGRTRPKEARLMANSAVCSRSGELKFSDDTAELSTSSALTLAADKLQQRVFSGSYAAGEGEGVMWVSELAPPHAAASSTLSRGLIL